jgi:tetratricopeptide (TPR) repeat protein
VAEYERNAIASAEQALDLDPAIGLAHSVIAAIDELNWRWADARRRAELAFQLSPNDVSVLLLYVRFTRSSGEYDESIRVNERWAQLEPTGGVYQQLAVAHRYARNYDAAAAAARKAIELNPAAASFRVHLSFAEAARGNRGAALQALQIAEQLFGGNFGQVFRVGQMAMAYALVDQREDAERMLALLGELDRESPVGEAIWAQAHLALGNFDQAHQYLEAAMTQPSATNYTTLIEIKANPWSIPELETPRFQEVLSGLWSVE